MQRLTIIKIVMLCLLNQSIAQEFLAKADSLYTLQEYQTAYRIYVDCAEKDSTEYRCLERAGMSAYRMGSMKKAKDHFLQLIDKNDHYQRAAIQLASIYETEENIPKAIKYNILLRDSFPENPIYHRKLGNLLLKANLPSEAFPEYAKALKLNPEDILTIRGIAELFIHNNQLHEADSILRKGLAIDSENIGLNYLFARNFYKAKEYDSTAMVLWKMRGKVDFPNYYSKMLGYSFLQIDSLDLAIRYLTKSLVDETDPEYAHYYLGNAYEMKGEINEAIFHLGKAIDAGISKGVDLYYRNRARLHKEENNLAQAIKDYEWSYRINGDPVLLFYLARASDDYYADKNIAIRYYQRYIKSNHDDDSYKKYARKRVRYLKELRHQKNISSN